MTHVLRLVSDATTTRTTLVDLNDGNPMRLGSEERDWGTEGLLQRAEAENLLSDGGVLNAARFGLRTIRLPIRVLAATRGAAYTAVQPLLRYLNRSLSILEWQPTGASQPVFFRLLRSPSFDIDDPDGESRALLNLDLRAEPFAVGLRVDAAAPVVVPTDPAAASGCYTTVTGVLGDVDTPAFLRLGLATSPAGTLVVASRHSSQPINTSFRQQAEVVNPGGGTDTTVAAGNDPAMSGSGANHLRTTFATTPGMATRMYFVPPASRDLYRMWVRHRRQTAGDTIAGRIRFQAVPGVTAVTMDTVTHPAGVTGPYWVDYGLVPVPLGSAPTMRGSDGVTYTVDNPTVDFQLQRAAGAGWVDTDVAVFVPSGAESTKLDLSAVNLDLSAASAVNDLVLDGPGNAVYAVPHVAGVAPPTAVAGSGPIRKLGGALPALRPGVTNEIYLLDTTTGLLPAPSLAAPTALAAATSSTQTTTSAAFTPSASSLIIVLVTGGTGAGGPPSFTISDTFGGLVWTKVERSGTGNNAAAIFYATAPSSPTSGTVTATFAGTASHIAMQPFEVVGAATPPVGATGTAQAATVNLSAAPASSSLVVTLIENFTGGTAPVFTPPAGYTALVATTKTGTTNYWAAAYKLTGAAQAVAWTNTNMTNPAAAAVEVIKRADVGTTVVVSYNPRYLYVAP